jgi:hypothetical protein
MSQQKVSDWQHVPVYLQNLFHRFCSLAEQSCSTRRAERLMHHWGWCIGQSGGTVDVERLSISVNTHLAVPSRNQQAGWKFAMDVSTVADVYLQIACVRADKQLTAAMY